MNDEYVPTEFERKLSELHLQLYHLMMDVDTNWCQASGCKHVLTAFEECWDKTEECKEL